MSLKQNAICICAIITLPMKVKMYYKEDNGNILVFQQVFMWLPLHLNHNDT
jgi:hypothetical protein